MKEPLCARWYFEGLNAGKLGFRLSSLMFLFLNSSFSSFKEKALGHCYRNYTTGPFPIPTCPLPNKCYIILTNLARHTTRIHSKKPRRTHTPSPAWWRAHIPDEQVTRRTLRCTLRYTRAHVTQRAGRITTRLDIPTPSLATGTHTCPPPLATGTHTCAHTLAPPPPRPTCSAQGHAPPPPGGLTAARHSQAPLRHRDATLPRAPAEA